MLFKFKILLKLIVYKLFAKHPRFMNDETYNKLIFFITYGRKADFDHPQTFNEYICARKVRRDEYDLWTYTDKYQAREYVEKAVGNQYLNENYGVYDRYEDIDFENLPDRFALRCTHGSGMNMIVTDKASINHKKAARRFKKWLKSNYYYLGREKNYYKIPPRIICDRFLECKTQEGLPEAKVFCFNGKVKFISYNLNLDGKVYSNIYDDQWNRLDMRRGYANYEDRAVPKNAAEIVEVAEKLAAPFDFVRVDLYNLDNRIIFSELTFHSGGGFVPFTPATYDTEFAKYFAELENPV